MARHVQLRRAAAQCVARWFLGALRRRMARAFIYSAAGRDRDGPRRADAIDATNKRRR